MMNKGKTVKRRVFEIISCARVSDVVSKIFDISIITLIVLNALALVLETVDSLATFTQCFRIFEIVSVVIFSIEYLLRIWTCSYIDTKYKGVLGKIRYILSFYALVDLMAILPFYLPFLIKIDLRFLRLFRILRKIKKKGMSLPDFLFMDILPLIASIPIKHYLSIYAPTNTSISRHYVHRHRRVHSYDGQRFSALVRVLTNLN